MLLVNVFANSFAPVTANLFAEANNENKPIFTYFSGFSANKCAVTGANKFANTCTHLGFKH